MVAQRVPLLLMLGIGCQGSSADHKDPAARPRTAREAPIEVRDAAHTIVARVQPGHPCRAMVDGVELLVGGRPLVAQNGADRWTGEDAENGTTLRKNDQIVARIHANQLFDADGVPVIRLLESNQITDKANAVIRTIAVGPDELVVGHLSVTGTKNVALAAMLTAQEASPEIRALAACHYLLEKSH